MLKVSDRDERVGHTVAEIKAYLLVCCYMPNSDSYQQRVLSGVPVYQGMSTDWNVMGMSYQTGLVRMFKLFPKLFVIPSYIAGDIMLQI